MSDHFLTNSEGKVTGVISLANIFYYKGFYFEFHRYCGPWRVNKKTLDPCSRAGTKPFWNMIDEWIKLSDEEKEKTRIYG